GELRLVARITDGRFVDLRFIVDRVDQEIRAAAAEELAARFLVLAHAEMQVPARADPFVDAGAEGFAFGLEVQGRRGLPVDLLRRALEAGEARERGVGAVTRRLAEIDEIAPVALPAVLEAQIAVVQPEVAAAEVEPGAGGIVASPDVR